MKKKILVIDDEDDLRDLIKSQLELNHYEVIAVADGMAGFVKAKDEKPDLIILDIMMPNLDGRTLALQFKEEESLRSIPIIVMTASDELAESVEGKMEIAHTFIKPFDTEEFILKVKELVGDPIEYE